MEAISLGVHFVLGVFLELLAAELLVLGLALLFALFCHLIERYLP